MKLTVTKNMNIRAAFKFRYVKVAIGKTENGSITIKTAEGKLDRKLQEYNNFGKGCCK